MRSSITRKLTFAMLGLTTVVLAATLALSWWSFQFGFLNYVNDQESERLGYVAETLATWYGDNGRSWLHLDERTFRRIVDRHTLRAPPRRGPGPPGLGRPDDKRRPPPPRGQPPSPPGGAAQTWLIDATGKPVVGQAEDGPYLAVGITFEDQVVGELRTSERSTLTDPLQTRFAASQLEAMTLIAVVALLLTLAIARLVSGGLLAPIRRTISGVEALAAGAFDTRFEAGRRDELGTLMQNLNRLAAGLDDAQATRRRWLADVSHELRTPITVLRAELEALRDRVRPLSAASLTSFEQEVQRIGGLIDDLYDLSLADIGGLRYEFADVGLSSLLLQVCEDQQRRHPDLQIALECPDRCLVRGDAQRLTQLFVNLLRNACAYTDTPGDIRIQALSGRATVEVRIDDSPPGVPETTLTNLFEPLFRQEDARDRRRGGAGLGLAICANIVRAHDGVIAARRSGLGGLGITLELPRA